MVNNYVRTQNGAMTALWTQPKSQGTNESNKTKPKKDSRKKS